MYLDGNYAIELNISSSTFADCCGGGTAPVHITGVQGAVCLHALTALAHHAGCRGLASLLPKVDSPGEKGSMPRAAHSGCLKACWRVSDSRLTQGILLM